jgi:hypothetical protein
MRLHEDLVAVRDQLANPCGYQTDTIFVDLDFLGTTDLHDFPLRADCWSAPGVKLGRNEVNCLAFGFLTGLDLA